MVVLFPSQTGDIEKKQNIQVSDDFGHSWRHRGMTNICMWPCRHGAVSVSSDGRKMMVVSWQQAASAACFGFLLNIGARIRTLILISSLRFRNRDIDKFNKCSTCSGISEQITSFVTFTVTITPTTNNKQQTQQQQQQQQQQQHQQRRTSWQV